MLNDRFWNEYMLRYDDAIGTLRPYRELIDRCVEWAAPCPGQTIVDVGCGTGNLLAQVASTLEGPAELIGVERSAVAGKLAADKLAASTLAHGHRFRLLASDLEQPGWSAELSQIDTAFMVNVLYDLQDPAASLDELRGRLRRGGRLIISNPHTPRPRALLDAHERWREQVCDEQRLADDRHVPARRWMLEVNTEIARLARGRRVHFLGVERMLELLRATGYVVTRIATRVYAGLNLMVVAERIA
jgi:SAM-dependent methyltransferase